MIIKPFTQQINLTTDVISNTNKRSSISSNSASRHDGDNDIIASTAVAVPKLDSLPVATIKDDDDDDNGILDDDAVISKTIKYSPAGPFTATNKTSAESHLYRQPHTRLWNKEESPNAKFSKLKETISQHAKPHEMINPDDMHYTTVDHPHHSPRNGTFIEYDYFKQQLQLLPQGAPYTNDSTSSKTGSNDDGYADIGEDDDDGLVTDLDDDVTLNNTTSAINSISGSNQLHATTNAPSFPTEEGESEVLKLLTCTDQHDCIIPALQLQVKMNVYLCKRPKEGGGGVRFFFLIKQGLLLHPNVNLITDLYNLNVSSKSRPYTNQSSSSWSSWSWSNNSTTATATVVDYFLYLPGSSIAWEQSECNPNNTSSSLSSSPSLSMNTTNGTNNINTMDNHQHYLYNTTQKLIILEEFDGTAPLYSPYRSYNTMKRVYGASLRYYHMYFKRSFVGRRDGRFRGYPLINSVKPVTKTATKKNSMLSKQVSDNLLNSTLDGTITSVTALLYKSTALITAATQSDIYPFTYPIAEDYIPTSYNVHTHREISILCTLRGSKNSSSPMSTRMRTQEWVTEYTVQRNLTHTSITQPVSEYE